MQSGALSNLDCGFFGNQLFGSGYQDPYIYTTFTTKAYMRLTNPASSLELCRLFAIEELVDILIACNFIFHHRVTQSTNQSMLSFRKATLTVTVLATLKMAKKACHSAHYILPADSSATAAWKLSSALYRLFEA